MLDRPDASSERILSETTEFWCAAFNAALAGDAPHALLGLFVEDSHWRNLLGISWNFATFSGREKLVGELLARAREVGAAGFRVDASALPPRRNVVAGSKVIEAIIRFDTNNGPGVGAVRLLPQATGHARAWTFSTSLDFNAICDNRAIARDWIEQRTLDSSYDDRDPDVLVVGGGHAGISAAVELKRIGLSALVVDREQCIGDNWRLRYRGLKLHNKTPVNHCLLYTSPSPRDS